MRFLNPPAQLICTAVLLLAPLVAGSAADTSPPGTNAPAPAAAADLLLREVRYVGTLTDTQARFEVEFDAESTGKNETSLTLFEGDVALMPAKLPAGLRIVRDGNQYRLVASRPGRYRFKLELVARITRAEPWNQVSFLGAPAAIASVAAAAEAADVELQLLSGTALESAAEDKSRVRGVLGTDRKVALRWQGKTAQATRQALIACETAAAAQITPTVIKFTTQLRYEIVQGSLSKFSVALPANHALTRVEGEQIRDWRLGVATDAGSPAQILTVELIKPVENSYVIKLYSEQAVESTPATAQLAPPQPQGVERETGSFTVSAEDTVVETQSLSGLRQVNAPAGALAAYRFHGRPLALTVNLRRTEPALSAASRVLARAEEARLLVSHDLLVTVEKTGIYSLELAPLGDFIVTNLRGDGVEDWKVRDGKLLVNFASRVLGERRLLVQLELPQKTFSDQLTVPSLRVTGAFRHTSQIGATAAPGISIKTAELIGLREISINSLTNRTDESLAYVADQADWTLKLAAEKRAPRIIAEIFNLVTVGDGLLGGSATIRYAIINQGAQEFRLKVPALWKNVDFTGPNIRRKEQVDPASLPAGTADTNYVFWIIGLQEKAWGGYTLVVTYDQQFDPHKATLPLGGIHALDAERETGSVAITSAASLQLHEARATGPLHRIDESELAPTDRALITRSVLLAYRYGTADTYSLAIEVTRFPEARVLEAVADRTQLTTVVTEMGEMLTQATFMVKNNDKQFQKFTLPEGARFWSAYVNGQPAKAEADGAALMVPLPRQSNRDQLFAVEIVYAQKAGSLKSLAPRGLALAAPRTDIQTTFAEWELYLPVSHQLARFGGNMSVARGTTYSLRDAWTEFATAYRELWRSTKGLLAVLVGLGVVAAMITAAVRRGWTGAMTALVVVAIGAVLAAMLLPGLAKAKASAQRISAVNNLKQIGLATRIYANDNKGRLPSSFTQMRNELGTEKVLIDPVSGAQFVYLGAGKTENDAGAVIAYSPVDVSGRAVLFGDGSVAQMTSRQFEEVMQHGSFAANSPALSPPGSVAGQLAPGLAGAAGGGVAGGGPAGTGIGATAAGPVGVPMAQGLRPIRIDIPRTGQKFTFTKVLNVGDDALRVEALAVASKVLNTCRSVLQVSVFIAGLLLLGWQFRRPNSNSLVATLALALILGSVGHLLITTRLLGLALVAAVPVAILGLIAFAARNYWLQHRPDAAGETGGVEPTPSPGGSPGMGPVAAALVLFCFAGTAHASDVVKPPAVRTPQPALEPASILSASYTGVVQERVAQIEAVLQISAARPGELIPLFGEDVAVEDFSAVPGSVKLLRQGESVSARLSGKGAATVRVKFLVKLGGDVTRRRLGFGIPPALSSKLALTVNEPDAAVDFPSAVSYHSVAAQQQTRVEAVMGAGDRVELQWTPRVKRAAEIAATVFCQNAALVNFTGGVMSVRSLLEYQVTQGELREVRVRLPAGHRLLRVEGDSIRTWQVRTDTAPRLLQSPPGANPADSPGADPGGDGTGAAGAPERTGPVLVVDLVKGVSPNYRLTLETEKTLDALPGNFTVELPHALDVRRETGWLALSGSDELGLNVETVRGLQKVDTGEFLKLMPQEKPLAGAYQFLKPEFALLVRVETLQPQIEAGVRNRVRIGVEQTRLDAQVDYTVKRAGVFGFRLGLPAGFRVENVTGGEISQWIEKNEGNDHVLEVTLKQRTLGAYPLRIALVESHKELARTIGVAGVHPLDTVKLTGYLVVGAEVGVEVKTASIEGLTEVPLTAVGGGAGVPPEGPGSNRTGVSPGETPGPLTAGLAFQYIANEPVPTTPPWKLVVITELVESWVRAEVVHSLTLGESLATGRAVVRYEIQNAPVREFRLKIPAAFKNVEINGANIRRRDHTGAEWQVELQNRVAGAYYLTVTWEQPWGVNESGKEAPFDAAGIEVSGVERETGMYAVIARSSLQVKARDAGAELIRADAQELPDWAGPADESTVLVYRYLRPGFKLPLVAQRFAQAEVLQALVEDARLTTVVADDGQMMTELALSVRNNGRQFLEISLPQGAQIWSAFVAGQAVKPGLRDGKLLLPLERTGDSALSVEVIYTGAEKFPQTKGTVALASPALDVPVKNARWELFLPPDYGYHTFGGTMTREADAAPVVRTFSALEYKEAEQGKKRALEIAATSSRDEVRRKLSSGKLEEASQAYDRARRSGLDAETEEFKVLAKDIREAQSSNLLKAQNEIVVNNSGYFRQDGAVPVQQLAAPVQLDDKTAQQQWERLQRAQEVASRTVRPLRVNLPARGLRHSFAQVLQTEVGKPMLISFVASNAKAVNWPMRMGWCGGGFAAMWMVVRYVLRQKMSS